MTTIEEAYRRFLSSASDDAVAEHLRKTEDALAGGPTLTGVMQKARGLGIPDMGPEVTERVLRSMLAALHGEIAKRRAG